MRQGSNALQEKIVETMPEVRCPQCLTSDGERYIEMWNSYVNLDLREGSKTLGEQTDLKRQERSAKDLFAFAAEILLTWRTVFLGNTSNGRRQKAEQFNYNRGPG